MTANTTLQSEAIRHQIALLKYGNGLANEIVKLLNSVDAEIVAKLIDDDLTQYSEFRLRTLLDQLRAINDGAYKTAFTKLELDLVDLSVAMAESSTAMLVRATAIPTIRMPSPTLLRTIATSSPIGGKLLETWREDMSRNKVRAIEQSIRTGMVQGETTDQIVRKIKGTSANKFRDGVFEKSRQSAKSLVLTATATVNNDSRDTVYQENSDIIRGVQWLSTLDTRTTSQCQSLDGTFWKLDDPKRKKPPLHIRCFPASTNVTTSNGVASVDDIRRVTRHWFDGDLIVITTASGKKLSATPNHPILTASGFIPISAIAVGDDVICQVGVDGVVLADDNHQNVKTTIAEVADTFSRIGQVVAAEMPMTAEDFHGDGTDGEIAIIWSDSQLSKETLTSLEQQSPKFGFMAAASGEIFAEHFSDSAVALFTKWNRSPAHRLVGCTRQLLAVFEAGASHARKLLLAAVADMNSKFAKTVQQGDVANTNDFGDAFDANSAVVKGNGSVDIDFDFSASGADTGFVKPSDNSSCSDPELARAIFDGCAGSIESDKVVNVEASYFSGHVYNLETEDSYYHAEGVVVHNCRSVLLPVTKSFNELGIDRDEISPKTRASMDGQVPAKTTYSDWLKAQSAERQNEILGPTRAKLFRENRLEPADLYRMDGSYKSLDELRAMLAK